MDEIPFAYGLATAGTAAAGNLVAGPIVKDAFIFHQSVVTPAAAGNFQLPAANAALVSVALHRVLVADFPVAQPAGALTHNHQMSFQGTNDGISQVQHGIHIRDDGTLPATTLARAGSFFPNIHDIRINSGILGPSFGHAASAVNGWFFWHEFGHKFSLRHAHDPNSGGAAAFVLVNLMGNNTDVTGDATNDGVARIQMTTYRPQGTVAGTTLVRASVAETVFFAGAPPRGGFTHAFPPIAQDSFMNDTDRRYIWNNNPIPGAPGTVFSRVIFPTLMDWIVYVIAPNGPAQQGNLNTLPQLYFGAGVPTPGLGAMCGAAPTQCHNAEVRARTEP